MSSSWDRQAETCQSVTIADRPFARSAVNFRSLRITTIQGRLIPDDFSQRLPNRAPATYILRVPCRTMTPDPESSTSGVSLRLRTLLRPIFVPCSMASAPFRSRPCWPR
jgi:hypothetical protein